MDLNVEQLSGYLEDRRLPENSGFLAGYSALIHCFGLKVPLPDILCFISDQHRKYTTDEWKIFTPRHRPEDSWQAHVVFALKNEGVYLNVLKALFSVVNPEELESWIQCEPSGAYTRRVWFLYEWLMGQQLNVADAVMGNVVDAINGVLQFTVRGDVSKRHRVRNNLPGTPDFCPLVRCTDVIKKFIGMDLSKKVIEITGIVHQDLLSRAAAYLLLQDSRASFSIEGESSQQQQIERWGRVIAQAGFNPLSLDELQRLQDIVIENQRFVTLGFRREGGFIGVHDRITQQPIPDHVSARWQDLPQLMNGLIASYNLCRDDAEIDPVLVASVVAFGFVFIHPFEDGNGRIHRYLIHHVLSQMGFSRPGMIFPISAVIQDRILDYKKVLESYSQPRLEFIEWRSTDRGNVDVLNETIDLYRYFDATKMVEFLYQCVYEAVETVLPNEINYLRKYDEIKISINNMFDMPDYRVDLLIGFLRQNNGTLSKRAREKEFKELNTDEIIHLERLYDDIFK